MRDSFGRLIPSAMPQLQQQQLAVLRVLGRLEYATTAQLAELVYASFSRRWAQRRLQELVADGLIWRVRVPFVVVPSSGREGRRAPPMKLPNVFGLTPAGRTALDVLEAEPDRRSLEALKARDPQARPPGKLTLTHDLQASWWCTSLLQALRRHPHVRSVFMQVEFVVHERQRIDALVVVRLSPKPVEVEPHRWPFFDGTPRRPDEVEVRLALEVDRGTEALPILLAKGEAYRDLHAHGTYARAFGGPVMPVFLAPTARRVAQIAREWRDIWPEGWGIISTPRAAAGGTHGVLEGDYRSLITGAPLPLLTVLASDPATGKIGPVTVPFARPEGSDEPRAND